MIEWLKSLFRKKIPCAHTANYTQHQYLANDGTPMVHFYCHDCGFRDTGHVYGDAAGWEKTIMCLNGKAETIE